MKEFVSTYLFPFLATVITGVVSYVGMQIKKAYTKYTDTRNKKEIVSSVVSFVEQTSKDKQISCEEKFNSAKEKANEWLSTKGIKASDAELEILIEDAVNNMNKKGT